MPITFPNLSSPDFDRLGPVLLVGHRGSGKSTLGPLASKALTRQFFDLDHELERLFERSIDLQLQNLATFRARESELLAALAKQKPAPIIACGAGVESLPPGALIIWLDREDWTDAVQNSSRPRVRPELTLQEEWAWMQTTRTPRWQAGAHLKLPIPRGRSIDQSARELITLLTWLAATKYSPLAPRTFFVPLQITDLTRAQSDALRFGFAGIELRSDIFPDRPAELQTPFIASLRTPDPAFFSNFQDAFAWDIDLNFLKFLPEQRPKRLILSLHPQSLAEHHINRLIQAARRFPDHQITLKYAPKIHSWEHLRRFFELVEDLRASKFAATALPQGPFAWTRPILAAQNETNYLPVGLRERDPNHPSTLDLQNFLPHLAGPYPTHFDALVGDPVAKSQGDLWHRRYSLEHGEAHRSYLKINVPSGEFDSALKTLSALPIRGLSVTSPLKKEAAQSPLVKTALDAINTLKRGPRWLGTDTDEVGMTQTLAQIESLGIGPGRAILIGRGGVSPAISRALKKRRWDLVAHLSARQGFQQEHRSLQDIALIVNAGGPTGGRSPLAPPCTVWLDLHYSNILPAPSGTIFLQGDLFFDAQARAQRHFWQGS